MNRQTYNHTPASSVFIASESITSPLAFNIDPTTTPLIPLALVKRALRLPVIEALSYAEAKQRFERNYLVQLLKLTEGNVADAARIADRNRTEFYRLLQKYDLTPGMFRSNVNPAPD